MYVGFQRIPKKAKTDIYMAFSDTNVTYITDVRIIIRRLPSNALNSPVPYRSPTKNCVRKYYVQNEYFMSRQEIIDCVKTITMKNCKGYERILQRILADGLEVLIEPLTTLFH